MKIAKIESFICDAGWRPWVFVKVETDDGLVGWGECSDGRMPRSVAAGMSMLSVPKPEVDTMTRSFPASRISALTRSGVRTHKARAPYNTCLISSALLLSTTTTSAPPSASKAWPAGSYIDLQSTTFPLDTAVVLLVVPLVPQC